MAYSTNSDIQSEFKNLAYSSSGITSAEVDEFIAQEDAYIDGRIGNKYDTPVTARNSVKILKTISIQLVAARVKTILAVKTGIPVTDQDSSSNLAVMAKEKLEQIVKGDLLLSDADLKTANDGVDSFAVSDSIDHVFDRDKDQW